MSAIGEPLWINPVYVERVWGRNGLRELFGKDSPQDRMIGESWELSDRPEAQSVIAGGNFDGCTLEALRQQAPQALLGTALAACNPTRYPLLVKYVDAGSDLSVQVHPDDAGCQMLKIADRGKTECWVVVYAAPGSRMNRGLKPGVGAAQFEAALRNGSVENLLHFFTPEVGDIVAIPPGMVHAIGGGITVAEIQQNSDVTFRIYDYNRPGLDGKPRPLHVAEALQTVRFDGAFGDFFEGDMQADTVTPRLGHADRGVEIYNCLQGRYFDLQRIQLQANARYSFSKVDCSRILMVLSGNGSLAGRSIASGQTLLLPADISEVHLQLQAHSPLCLLQSSPTAHA